MAKTRKFEYLPGLEFDFSTVYSYGVKTERVNQFNYGDPDKYTIDKNEKNAPYISWFSKENEENILTSLSGFNVAKYHYHNSHTNNMYLHVFPNKEIYDKMVKRYKYSTVLPTIIPTAYEDTDAIFEYIVNNKMAYNYKKGFLANGYYPSLQLHVSGEKMKRKIFDNFSYKEKAHKSAYEAQKQILHTIIMNEFLYQAIVEDDYSLTLEQYLNKKENIEHVKDCLSKFELSPHSHVEKVVKFFSKESYGTCSDKHFLRYSLYQKSIENRQAILPITATSVLNTLNACDTKRRFTDDPNDLFLQKYDIIVKNNAYNITDLIKQSVQEANSLVVDGAETKAINVSNLDCTNASKVVNSEYNHDVFTSSNIEDMTRILLEGRLAACVDGLVSSSEDKTLIVSSVNSISSASQTLSEYVSVKRSNSMVNSLVTVFNAVGYDYLRYRVRPTELAALVRLARVPTLTLSDSKHLSNMLKFFESNLIMDRDDEAYNLSRDYMFGIIYKVVMDMEDVVFDASTVDSSLKEITENFSVTNVPVEFVCNILFTSFEPKSQPQYNDIKMKIKIDEMRDIGL